MHSDPSQVGRPRAPLAVALALVVCSGCAATAVVTPAATTPPPAPASTPVPETLALEGLMVPVAGVWPEQVPDTYLSDRGGRPHLASDIAAPRGTPVVAATSGTVLRVGQNRLGGNMIYATDARGELVYYYAHLQSFSTGLRAGAALSRGQILGTVGTTGNAPPNHPHLHFQVMLRRSDGSIYGGEPLDARPYFRLPGAPSYRAAPGEAVSLAGQAPAFADQK